MIDWLCVPIRVICVNSLKTALICKMGVDNQAIICTI
jgi:hypothetical protein